MVLGFVIACFVLLGAAMAFRSLTLALVAAVFYVAFLVAYMVLETRTALRIRANPELKVPPDTTTNKVVYWLNGLVFWYGVIIAPIFWSTGQRSSFPTHAGIIVGGWFAGHVLFAQICILAGLNVRPRGSGYLVYKPRQKH